MRAVTIATRNRKKKKELQTLLKGLHLTILTLEDYPAVPKIREDGTTFDDNAAKKAVVTSRYTKTLTLADDSGLEVDALGGKPGIRSSRFSGPGANDKRNIQKLLRLMKDVPRPQRGAQFVCSIALACNGKLLTVVRARCRGRITAEAKGDLGFGYDPVFIARGYGRTFAELPPSTKNGISHRGRALRKAKRFIKKYFEKNS